MGKKQAVIMELDKRSATVLAPDGSFSKVPRRADMSVGEVVSLTSSSVKKRPWMMIVAAAAMVVIMLYTSFVVLPANKVMAYVMVDAVPGVELAVNGWGKVIGTSAVTPDGEQLLASLVGPKGSLADAVAQLTSAALSAGHVSDEQDVVVVTVAPAHNGVENKLLTKIEQVADEAVQQVLAAKQSKAKTGLIKLTPEVREEAKRQGVPPGLYVVALKAADEGIEVDLEELRGENVAEVLKRKGAQVEEVIERAKEENDLNELLNRVRDKLRGNRGGEQTPQGNGSDSSGNSPPGPQNGSRGRGAK